MCRKGMKYTEKQLADMFDSYADKYSVMAQEALKDGDLENYNWYGGQSSAFQRTADFFRKLDNMRENDGQS